MKLKNFNKFALFAAAVVIPKVINDFTFNNAKAIKNPLNGDYRIFNWRNYNIYYTQAGEGSPVLLVHGIGSGASSYTFRKNFDQLAKHHTVYAVDLLGFGMSDRPKISYYSDLYIELISDFVKHVIREKTDIIAASLSGAYCIKAAAKNEAYFGKLILLNPAGIVKLSKPMIPSQEMFYKVLKAPYFGTSMYNMISSKRNIRCFLEDNMFYDKDMVTDEMVNHYYNSSHFKGESSKYVIAAFISGHLNADASEELKRIKNPILAIWGKHSKLSPEKEAKSFENLNENVKTIVYDQCGISPSEEMHKDFNKDAVAFLEMVEL